MRNSVNGREIHKRILEFFPAGRIQDRENRGRMQGFFHGTGHGLGLDIHEAPRVGLTSTDVLRRGMW